MVFISIAPFTSLFRFQRLYVTIFLPQPTLAVLDGSKFGFGFFGFHFSPSPVQ